MKILGKEGFHDLDFNIPKGKVTSRQVAILNIVEEEIPSASDLDKVGDIELQEIVKSTEDLIFQIKNVQNQGLKSQLTKVEVAKRFSWKSTSRKRVASSRNFENILEFMMMQ